MEEEGKPSINTQFRAEDGKIVALQADPECREMKRLLADLNKRVIRVQSHGLASWERAAERGRPLGFGVEVAREAVEEEAEEGEERVVSPFYAGADEPAREDASELVGRYLEGEGRPGPVDRASRWLAGGPRASCCCAAVQAVAGKMTIAQASGMRDEAVDRLLVDVYFQQPPRRAVASKVLRRATEMSRRLSQRVKSAARRVSRRLTEYRGGNGASVAQEEVARAEADTVQLRQPRGPGAASLSDRAGSRREQADGGAEAAPAERRDTPEGEQFHSAQSSLRSSEEGAGSGEGKAKLQSGTNVGVYQVLLEGDDENADESHSDYQWLRQITITPNDMNRISQEDKSLTGDQNEPSHYDRHNTIMEDDCQIKRLQVDTAKAKLNAEKDTPNSSHSEQCIRGVNEKSKSPDPVSLSGKDTGTSGTHLIEERRGEGVEESKQKPDSGQQQDRRRVVGNLDLFILNDSSEFDWEPVPERSEEEVLASQHMGGLEFEEDYLDNNEDSKSSSVHSHIDKKLRD